LGSEIKAFNCRKDRLRFEYKVHSNELFFYRYVSGENHHDSGFKLIYFLTLDENFPIRKKSSKTNRWFSLKDAALSKKKISDPRAWFEDIFIFNLFGYRMISDVPVGTCSVENWILVQVFI